MDEPHQEEKAPAQEQRAAEVDASERAADADAPERPVSGFIGEDQLPPRPPNTGTRWRW